MEQRITQLLSVAQGTRRELLSLHFGSAGSGEKIYIQASLHADEIPGMLVAQCLRKRLVAHEKAGRIRGEIVLVPVANPIGLAQSMAHSASGRFDFHSGENFNRNYPELTQALIARVEGKLNQDLAHNRQEIRRAMQAELAELVCIDELASLRRALLQLAVDADVVLDLHCDLEAVPHMYVGTPLWPAAEPLARLLRAEAVLLATESGGNPFDEACAKTWWELASHFEGKFPIPLACFATTIELRGIADVTHAFAEQDAAAVESFLIHRGVLLGDAVALPPPSCVPTPLAGSMPVVVTQPGVLVFLAEVGTHLKQGDAIADIVDPFTGVSTQLVSPVDGVLYAREIHRYVRAGTDIAKVAGVEALRTGDLLAD
ncbi:MAG: succinylglutamate desuccinylase/aspartoacylase family protein [Rhodocyclaceae bacterium]|nr:succinylglutamate desuccinylase/aspartoacylase family protein [Rhodocyclaceae bacterium]